MKVDVETTMKEVKKQIEWNIFGDLEPNQYFIYKGGGQEDKNTKMYPTTHYYKYTEPVLLDDDNKTLQDYDIHDNELLHLKVQLKLLKVPCCMFYTIYIFTYDTLKHIQTNRNIQR